jgi:mannosyltransferase OCH1-like enzyme
MIPARLIQTWKTEALPEAAREFQDRWRQFNPSLTLCFFDDTACRALIADVAPQHLTDYDSLPFGVMRADVFRYAALYRDGGVYADIDMEPLQPLPPDFFLHRCMVSVEARLTRRRQHELGYRTPFQIANCIMAAAPRHPFWLAAMTECFVLNAANPAPQRADIEDITGPRMLTRLFDRGLWPDISVMPRLMLMPPLQYPRRWPINRHMVTCHQAHGSWKAPTEAISLHRKLIERHRLTNPFRRPQAIDAGRFLQIYGEMPLI